MILASFHPREFMAYHDLKTSEVLEVLGWTRHRFHRVASGAEWITFEERVALAEAVGCAYPTLLAVKTRVVDAV